MFVELRMVEESSGLGLGHENNLAPAQNILMMHDGNLF